ERLYATVVGNRDDVLVVFAIGAGEGETVGTDGDVVGTIVRCTVLEEHYQFHRAPPPVDLPNSTGVCGSTAIFLVFGVRAVAAAGDEPNIAVSVRPGPFAFLNGRSAQLDDLLAHGYIVAAGIGVGNL